jgi:hypothetical protein
VLEIAAVLDANLLKDLIGEKQVNGLRGRAVMAKGKPPNPDATGVDALVPGRGGELVKRAISVPLSRAGVRAGGRGARGEGLWAGGG